MTISEKITNLINASNDTTSKSDTDLTTAVKSLIDGYGGSPSGDEKYYLIAEIYGTQGQDGVVPRTQYNQVKYDNEYFSWGNNRLTAKKSFSCSMIVSVYCTQRSGSGNIPNESLYVNDSEILNVSTRRNEVDAQNDGYIIVAINEGDTIYIGKANPWGYEAPHLTIIVFPDRDISVDQSKITLDDNISKWGDNVIKYIF